MVGFHRTFSTLLHLCEIAEILQTVTEIGPDNKKFKDTRHRCSARSHGYMPDGRVIGWSSIWVQNSEVGQIIESTPSTPRCYYLVLKADAGSVPCSATKLPNPNPYRLGFFLPDQTFPPTPLNFSTKAAIF